MLESTMARRALLGAWLTAALATSGCPGDGREQGDADADVGDSDTGDGGPAAECIAEPRTVPTGGACGCDGDCEAGLVCSPEEQHGFPHGFCTITCSEDEALCGDGVCELQRGMSDGMCWQRCTDHSECRPGWYCLYGHCNPFCTADEHCRSGSCDLYGASCGGELPPGDGELLDPCIRDDDCRSHACLTSFGGHCVVTCLPGLSECPEGALCVSGIDPNEDAIGLCLPTCESTDECPEGLDCVSAGGGNRVCWRAG